MDKFDKIMELNNLYKNGGISQTEYEQLKKGILSGETSNQPIETSSNSNRSRIFLKAYKNEKGVEFPAPLIEYINWSDISENEISVLGDFLKGKITFAPQEMTKDEVEISHKIFSEEIIAEIMSKRQGLNHEFLAIFGILSIGATIYAITVSIYWVYFGAIWGFLFSAYAAFNLINKKDSSKADKVFGYIIFSGVVIAAFLLKDKLT